MTDKSLKNLSGNWKMSKELSSDVTEVLEIQGFNKLLRMAVSKAPVYLSIKQKEAEEVLIEHSTTASIPAVNEKWYFDWKDREDKDAFLGRVSSKSRWVKIADVNSGDGKASFLTNGLSEDDEVVEADVESLDDGWKARQVWLFEGGNFVRRVITSKDGKRAETTLVYETAQ